MNFFVVGDFGRLHQLHQATIKCDITLNYSALAVDGTESYRHECDRVLSHLQNRKMYKEARLFSQVAQVTSQYITINQVKVSRAHINALVTSSSVNWKILIVKMYGNDILMCSFPMEDRF